jgi:hypothetical protein
MNDPATLSGRPRFFEGQYLSAEDLAAIVSYLRGADSRHALAGHTHGIAIGLHLTERSASGAPNRREVVLQPGFAWDGFGRPISVTQPTRLPETLFAAIPFAPALDLPGPAGEPAVGRLVKVWLAYAETESRAPAPGFESCASDDQNSRVLEGFDFRIGDFPPGPEQRNNVVIGTESLEPQDQLRHFDAAASLVFDAAVPHQTFPENPRTRWLVPVGYVRWVARSGTLGYFLQRDVVATDRVDERTRAERQYASVVAEYVHAADKHIVLHARDEDPLAPHRFASLIGSGAGVAEHRSNLVWAEGNLRVGGDLKIAGGKLHWRDVDGLDQGTPLYVDRARDGLAANVGRDLRAVIGPVAAINNRLIVGPVNPAGAVTPQFTVVSSGRVGVNTDAPVTTLDVRGNWDGAENGAVRVAGTLPTVRFGEIAGHDSEQWIVQAENAGNLKFAHRVAPAQWKAALHLTSSMSATPASDEPGVGIRSHTPRNPLAVRANGAWEELVSFEDAAGTTKWHLNQKVNGTTPGLNFCETGMADGRLFLKSGGDVGMGTIAPTNRLHVEGNTGIRQNRLTLSGGTGWSSLTYNAHHNDTNGAWVFPDPSRRAITLEMDDASTGTRFEVWSTGTPNNTTWTSQFRISGDSGNVAMAYNGGNVGVGTNAPTEKLHVAGAFIRIDGAGNEQAYLGGDAVANDVQIGSMRNGVSQVALWNTGSGTRMDLFCRNINCGDISAGNISGNWVSDARLKKDIAPIESPLALVKQLRGVSFRWNDERRKGAEDFGVIAQELQPLLPQLVHHGETSLGVSYISLIPILIEAVKELAGEVDDLRAAAGKAARPDKPGKTDKPEPSAKASTAKKGKGAKGA